MEIKFDSVASKLSSCGLTWLPERAQASAIHRGLTLVHVRQE